jgi:hypothetical protein
MPSWRTSEDITLTDADRVKLLFGPYKAPPLQRGDRATCLYRDTTVIITRWSDAPIGSAEFDAACRAGQRVHDACQGGATGPLRMHRLADLRARGIWPME